MKLKAKDKDLLATILTSRIRDINDRFLYDEKLSEKDRYTLINHAIPAHRRLLKAVADEMSPKKKSELYFTYNLDSGAF